MLQKKFLILSILVLAIIGIPASVYLINKQQEIRSRADQLVCQTDPTDSILVIDRSGSMKDKVVNATNTKITNAKTSAINFVDILSKDTRNQIGLVTFENTASLISPLTNNYTQIKNLISSITTNGYTCHECAINKTNQELIAHGRPGIKKVAILLTDGKANWVEGNPSSVNQSIAEQKALQAIKNISVPNHIVYYTIGLGNDVNSVFLKEIATLTGGKYYFSPSSDDLQSIYNEISQILAKGSVSGFVFDDANNNSTLDLGETKLPGWTINITNTTTGTVQSSTSDDTGGYNISNLCDGAYTLKQNLNAGWTQTLPQNGAGYQFTIDGGTAMTDKNFGNYIMPPSPTASPTLEPTISQLPQGANLLLTVFLHGIGNSGDNVNPGSFSLSNKNPLHPERDVTIEIYDALNQLTSTATGHMLYSSESGNFKSTLSVPNFTTTGPYTVKLKSPTHLRKQFPGIQTLKAGESNTLANITLVAGDINSDNTLSILDYNILIGCYSDLGPATSCTDDQKLISDLNDDGDVNQFDYNLFLREITVQNGE